MNNHKKQKGTSLIEVMVSVLIISFGVMGILALIIKSLQFSASSNYRTIAAHEASAMAEVLRTNPSMLAGFSAIPATGTTANTDCIKSAGCTSADWTTTTFALWSTQLSTLLPNGTGFVCRDSANDALAIGNTAPNAANSWLCDGSGPFVVKICWNETRAAIGSFSGGVMCSWTTI